jgi:hypothetical protein
MSEMVTKGIVQKMGKNKAGFWNVQLDDEWYSIGKGQPKFDKGATIQFTYTKNGQWNNADPKTVEVVAEAQAAPASKASSGAGGENWDARAKYWEDKDKRDIVNHKEARYRFALASAKDLVLAAVERGDIVLSEAKKKGAAFDSLLVYVYQTAEELFGNIDTFIAENAMEEDAKFAIPDDDDDNME